MVSVKSAGRILRTLGSFLVLVGFCLVTVSGQNTRARTPIRIPDIPGYKTLKGDFHMHTVFSDGTVWPDIRAEEAWREGLDVIAITDHIEYQPHAEDLPTNHDRSYEIAKGRGDALGVIVIPGSEVTRSMPPGHLNALFLESVEPLDTEEWRDAIDAASKQKAFVFWNHPGWDRQQPDGISRWYAEHTELLEKGALHGIEVVNGRDYYPEVHRWCLEKKLTMFANSDVHNPLNLDYHVHSGDHRPVTLVFAREATLEGVREALFSQRTAVYSGRELVGEEKFLRPIFDRSVRMLANTVSLTAKGGAVVQIQNYSDIEYTLELAKEFDELEFPDELVLVPGKTVLLGMRGKGTASPGKKTFEIPYTVKNLLVEPNVGMKVTLTVEVTFLAPENKGGKR